MVKEKLHLMSQILGYTLMFVGFIGMGIVLLFSGCGYSPSDVADFNIICSSCSSFLNNKTTTIHCRADSILHTASETKCRHCGKMLAEPGDTVSMTSLSGGVVVTKRGRY